MATGTPVISTDVGNVKNVVGNAGVVVPSAYVESIYGAMVKLVDNPKLWEMCSKESKTKARQYSWQENVKKLEKVYEDVLR